jgi:hypothetical protein
MALRTFPVSTFVTASLKMAEQSAPIWVASRSVNTKTFPSVDSDAPKEIMSTVGCPQPEEIYPGDTCMAALSSFASKTLDDILRRDLAKDENIYTDSEGRLARLVICLPFKI